MTDTAWAVAGTLGGVIIGGLLEYFRNRASFKRERGWEMREAQRERLERIFELLYEIEEAYGLTVGRHSVIAATGEPPSPDWEMKKIPWAELAVLTNLYHPELVEEVDALKDTSGSLAMVCVQSANSKASDVNAALGRIKEANNNFRADLGTVQRHVEQLVTALTKSAETTVG
jgi:hypothetical protein